MSIAYGPRSDAPKLTITKGHTLRQLLLANGLDGQLDTVGLYNWGTKDPAEINRALVELVGCSSVAVDPLDSVLDPGRGTKQPLLKPVPWTPTLAVEKVHTVKVKRRLPPTAVAITELTAFFDPATETCTARCRFEGADTRADKRDFEVHATGYFTVVKDREGAGTVEVEKPCGTDDVDEPSHTHLVRNSLPATPGMETITWDGTSNATEGVLKSPAKITSRCAPYAVLIRYYKDDTDKDARLKLEPFYPRWRLTGRARRELEETSLVVTWKLEAEASSKAKLKVGQLSVHDKDGAVAFFTVLTKEQLAAGSYDLLKGPVKWDKARVDPTKMPYRVQLQAHSDGDEDNGLALATMPTQVPVFAYEQVQLIGFNVRNDTNAAGDEYLGRYVTATDIRKRCEVMIDAIQRAHVDTDANRKILKVFVAPEFYFRGKDGAYPVEEISTILPKLRAETDKHQYLDWMFVFGTVIGRQLHESDAGGKLAHGESIHAVKVVTVDSATKITAKIWSAPKRGWVFQKGATKTKISADPVGAGVVDLADGGTTLALMLDSTAGLANGDDTEMIEPVMTIADTWPPFVGTKTQIKVASKFCARIPIDPGTKEVVTVAGERWQAVSNGITSNITKVDFKEAEGFYWLTLSPGGAYEKGRPLTLLEPVATEVFNVALVQKGWHAPLLGDGSLREVVTYKENISPIDFIRDANLAFHAKTGVNRKVKIDDTDDRPVLPTDGSSDLVGANPNVKRRPGSVVGSEINLSGAGGGSVFTMHGVTFGLEVCLDHAKDRLWNFYNGPNKRAGDPKVQVQLIPSWGMSIGGSDAGKEVSALPGGLIFNVDGSRMESVARTCDGTYSCDTHATKTGINGARCDRDASSLSAGVVLFKCSDAAHSKYLYPAGCPTHGKYPCNRRLQKLGAVIAATSTTDVPSSDDVTYFKKKGNVQVFPAKPLPDPDVVA
ncbi:hypothetical protein [Pyxidicoccus trucidator]|uniref:hypothetical protein n=1 Tax=Pyxidicoccus trucidator TaxID=2709662 RepID=UPI0013DB2B44|nr:hypothetical protein [Pyxidicoccus trucidator]